MKNMLLIKKIASNLNFAWFHISINVTDSVEYSIDFFEMKDTTECFLFLIDLWNIVMVVQCEFV